MTETKQERIDLLEHELGRYRKKVEDDAAEIQKLRAQLIQANEGNREINFMVNALLAVVTLKCGEDAVDPDDPGKVLGKRLVLDCFDVMRVWERYEVHARRDDMQQQYIIGVVERDAGQEEA